MQSEAKSLLAGFDFEVESHTEHELVNATDCSAYGGEFVDLTIE